MRIRLMLPDTATAEVLGQALEREGHTVIGDDDPMADLIVARYPHNMVGNAGTKVITLFGAREGDEYDAATQETWNGNAWAIKCPFRFAELVEAIVWLTLSREY